MLQPPSILPGPPLKQSAAAGGAAARQLPPEDADTFRLFTSLPPEGLSVELFAFLSCRDLSRLACTSRAMRRLASQPSCWRRLYLKDFTPQGVAALAAGPQVPLDLLAVCQHPQQAYKRHYLERTKKVENAR